MQGGDSHQKENKSYKTKVSEVCFQSYHFPSVSQNSPMFTNNKNEKPDRGCIPSPSLSKTDKENWLEQGIRKLQTCRHFF